MQRSSKNMAGFIKALEERTEPLDYFDENVWRFTVDKVSIFHDGRIIFQFVDGTEVEG